MGRAGQVSDLIPSRWLSPAMDDVFAAEPELIGAYDLEPYPSEMNGEGDWMMLYKDDGEPFAIIWYSAETQSVGIELGHNCYDTDLLTTENLRLRIYHNEGKSASEAYQEIASRYNASGEQTMDLATLKRLYVKPVR